MAHEIIMPALGMAQETGRLVAWLKNEGDAISKGEPLMEVETDKSTMEVEAQKDGFLANITALANTDVPVGEVVALIVDNLDDVLVKPEQAPTAVLEKKGNDIEKSKGPSIIKADANTDTKFSASVDVSNIPNISADISSSNGGDKILASPKLRSRARSENLDLKQLRNAGYPEPFKFKDLSALRHLSTKQTTSLRSNATSVVDTASFKLFLAEINSASKTPISSELVFVSFISASLRVAIKADNIGIDYKSGRELQSVFYEDPDKQQLAEIATADSKIVAVAQVNDLTSTDFIQLSGQANSDIIFTISNFTEQFMITLDWEPNVLSQRAALELLGNFSTRIKTPLKQLL